MIVSIGTFGQLRVLANPTTNDQECSFALLRLWPASCKLKHSLREAGIDRSLY
jgi:hypothetical protein